MTVMGVVMVVLLQCYYGTSSALQATSSTYGLQYIPYLPARKAGPRRPERGAQCVAQHTLGGEGERRVEGK